MTIAKTTLISEHIPLANKNCFGTGGSARFYCEPRTTQECAQALEFARKHTLETVVVGSGANVLISDEGIDGLVIKPLLRQVAIEDAGTHVHVTAGSGCSLDMLITHCFDTNILGLEEFSGIPSSVGGGLFNNLHYFQFCLGQFVVGATVMERASGRVHQVDNTWFAFGYDYSTLHAGEYIVLNATFKLRRADAIQVAHARGRYQEIVRHRLARYPYSGTCGSFFRNFLDHEVTLTSQGKKVVWIAYYLDKLGIKGTLSIGGAQVSHQHANMIVNTDRATSHDIVQLAVKMQELVLQHFGILPQPECELIGFKEYPLIRPPHTLKELTL